ncbi:MAG: metallophosphoesterase [Luteolibacter sp.]|uniref:metallophosphoesterase family protein n=1 Tax=Luteolibacter sp. TaxID=1962973 RepID=UPI0032638F7A
MNSHVSGNSSPLVKRRGFIGTVAGGLVAGVGRVASAQQAGNTVVSEVPTSPGPLMRTPAVLMAPRHDGVEVVWAVSKLSRGKVEWKNDSGGSGVAGADHFGFVPQGDEILRVRLDGMQPGTTYQIRAITESADGKDHEASPWKKFRTLDPAASSSSFVVWNDTHQNEETIRKLHAVTPPADFLLWNGDTCNNWDDEAWLIPTLLQPAGQDVSTERPLFLVWGNHDVRGKWAFKVPEMVATPEGRPYYAFRNGPLAVICLHTGEDKPDSHPSFGGRVAFDILRRQQAEWLKETIARPEFRDAPYRIVFCHIPLRWTEEADVSSADYGSGSYDSFSRASRAVWHDSLAAWKTQVVISGHTHSSAWLPATAEFPYAQLVGGGPKTDAATWIEGQASPSSLLIVMKNLAGEIVEHVEFPALAKI